MIPHGAWIPQADRNGFRHKLGLNEAAPLIGIFGFLKPYKRVAESLRAFRRLVRVSPGARLILVGEAHPELPVQDMIRTMGLSANARLLGFTPIEDFVGYLGACDIVLNLRYPTVGESSGTLLRALGLGKAVLVSDVGSFQEFPDDVCIKIAPGSGEEDAIFEALNLLVSRPEVARALGRAGRSSYVAEECNWDTVARQYAQFLAAPGETLPAARAAAASNGAALPQVDEYLTGWGVNEASRGVPGDASHALGEDARDYATGRAVRPHSGDGRVSADHARAAQQARVRRGARLPITARWDARIGGW